MNILVVPDGTYYKDKSGDVYVDSVFDYAFFARYLTAFEEVYAIVRAKEVDAAPAGKKRASGEHVHFLTIPSSHGVIQFFRRYFTTRRLIKKYIVDFDKAIFRIPGLIPNIVSGFFRKDKNKKFAVEVVVDPWEYFAKGTYNGIARPFVRVDWTLGLKKVCMIANGVSYVTENYLQGKYPCKALQGAKGYFTESYSSVELPDDTFASARTYEKKDCFEIAHVANYFSSYGKGHLVVMDAIKKVVDSGYQANVNFIGDGPLKTEFQEYVKKLGIEKHVRFLGKFPNGTAVRQELKRCDLFVFPTMAEGLPRCVLEAMAEGMPVLSSPVCGIPEILNEECLIPFDDPDGYADKIIELMNNPDEMTRLSKENLETALKFKNSALMKKRTSFYKKLRDIK